MSVFNSLLVWTQRTFEPLGAWGLFVLAFIESSFFLIPPDILLIALSLAAPERAFFLALVCTIGSVLGGMFGYGMGYVGERAFLERFVSRKKVEKVHDMFNRYEVWAIGIAGFTPIPYKIFTIAAGVFYIHFWKFVLVSLLSRGARFFLVASLIFFFGEPILIFLNKYFDVLSLVGVALLVPLYIWYKRKKR